MRQAKRWRQAPRSRIWKALSCPHEFDLAVAPRRARQSSPQAHDAAASGFARSDSRRSEGRTAAAEGEDLIRGNGDLAHREGEKREDDGADVAERKRPADAAEAHPALVAVAVRTR